MTTIINSNTQGAAYDYGAAAAAADDDDDDDDDNYDDDDDEADLLKANFFARPIFPFKSFALTKCPKNQHKIEN